jgi:hypothetical protein
MLEAFISKYVLHGYQNNRSNQEKLPQNNIKYTKIINYLSVPLMVCFHPCKYSQTFLLLEVLIFRSQLGVMWTHFALVINFLNESCTLMYVTMGLFEVNETSGGICLCLFNLNH